MNRDQKLSEGRAPRKLGSDAACVVGSRFRSGALLYRARNAPHAPLRDNRDDAVADEAAYWEAVDGVAPILSWGVGVTPQDKIEKRSDTQVGSLFSGYGGLDLAVEGVLGARTLWHCEIEDAPSRVLAARWPGVPNLGDITAVDWSVVPRVDVLTGGFPCQDVSHAGKRAGLKTGTRSGLWARMVDAIDALRPALVVAASGGMWTWRCPGPAAAVPATTEEER